MDFSALAVHDDSEPYQGVAHAAACDPLAGRECSMTGRSTGAEFEWADRPGRGCPAATISRGEVSAIAPKDTRPTELRAFHAGVGQDCPRAILSLILSLILTRHGKAAPSEVMLGGRLDLPLTAEGRREAQALGRRLTNVRIDRIVSSPMRRSLETAQFVADGRPSRSRSGCARSTTDAGRG